MPNFLGWYGWHLRCWGAGRTANGGGRTLIGKGDATRSIPRHNHFVVGGIVVPIPGVTPLTAQPRAVWHNALGVALIYPEKPQKPQQMPVFIGWNACCPFLPCDMIIRLSAMNSVGSRRKAWGWCRSLCRCQGVCGYGFCNGVGSQPILERVFCPWGHEKGLRGNIPEPTEASASKR